MKMLMLAAAMAATGHAEPFRAKHVHAYGGTAEFREFVRSAAEDGVAMKLFDDVNEMPFASATNALFLIVPRYARGEETVSAATAETVAAMAASAKRGNRFYVENMPSGDETAKAFTGFDTFSSRLRPIWQMTIETDCGRLQSRRGRYMPAGRHFCRSVRDRAKVVAGLADSIGVNSVFVPATQRFPLATVSADGSRFAAMTRLAPYDPKFMRPYAKWRRFYSKIFAPLTGSSEERVSAAFSKAWPDFIAPGGGKPEDVARKAVAWHEKSGILKSPDGAKGMNEAITSDTFGWRSALRTDCHIMTGALFAMAGKKYGRPDWTKIGENLVDLMLQRGNQTEDGYFRWFDRDYKGEAGHQVYATDHGRCTLAMINMYRATGKEKYRESARKALDAFVRWQNGSGRVSVWFDLNGRQVPKKGNSDNPVCYYENVPALLAGGEMFGDAKYTEAAVRATDSLAKVFPGFNLGDAFYSVNSTYGRFLMAAASVQLYTGRDYSEKINGVLDFYEQNQHAMGGIAEVKIRLVANEEAGVGIGDGSDHIADLLYCNNFSFAGLSILMKMPEDRLKSVDIVRARRIYGRLRDFLAAVQISSADPKFDGAWMRAFDMDIGEYHGLDRDSGWGPYCVETGWTTGTIPLVFMYDGIDGSYFAK